MPIDILVVTTLYPNRVQFRHGVFVENRIRHLAASGEVNVKVIAPVPWFPCKLKLFPEYSKLLDIPEKEERYGIRILHPRYLVIPKIGMWFTPLFLASSLYRQIKLLQKQGESFHILDAHYYYPDGVAAAIVAKAVGKPLSITARGTDINLIANLWLPRKLMLWAGKVATLNLAVCEALRQRMLEIGIRESTAHVLRNGVDLSLFKPMAREELRKARQISGKLLISVGHLIERKGHHLVVEALACLPDYTLFIVGGGALEGSLRRLARQIGVQDRVFFLGEINPQQLPELYNCADALVLASDREGWANVLLESMACGTPVVASNIWGTPEVVQVRDAGVLCERSVQGIVGAVQDLFADYPDRLKTRQYAEKFSWDETTKGLLRLFSKVKPKDQAG